MTGNSIEPLIERIEDRDRHTETLDSEKKGAVRVSCSMAGRPPETPLWPVDRSWRIYPVTKPGNPTWEQCGDERTLDGSIGYLATTHDVEVVQVVGHTSCTVVENAYRQRVVSRDDATTDSPSALAPLGPVIDGAIDAELMTPSMSAPEIQHRLVEYNVVRQVEFLCDRLDPSILVTGYVHDEDGAYDTFPDKYHLVTVDGETDCSAIRTEYPVDDSVSVEALGRY